VVSVANFIKKLIGSQITPLFYLYSIIVLNKLSIHFSEYNDSGILIAPKVKINPQKNILTKSGHL